MCAAIAALPVLGSSGCFTDSDGLDPPIEELYFPTNLVVSPGGKALYVTNSDFDLQYNGGTVQVLALEAIRAKALTLALSLNDTLASAPPCAAAGLDDNAERILYPGPCSPLDLVKNDLVKNTRTIGAFASGAILVRHPDRAKARLFVSVRGDPSVTYFDVPDDTTAESLATSAADARLCDPTQKGSPFCMSCDATGAEARCGGQHLVGVNESDSSRGLTLLVEPIGIAASPSGEAIVTAHQTEQAASLVLNRWNPSDPLPNETNPPPEKPALEYTLGGLPFGPTELAALPEPGFVSASGPSVSWQPGFVVTYRAAAEIDLLRYNDDREANPVRPFLTRAVAASIAVNARGSDSRGVAIDSSERVACEEACAAGATQIECMRSCTETPLRLFVASRAPESLLIGEVRTKIIEREGQPTAVVEDIAIQDTIPLAFGASRVAVGQVIGKDNQLHTRVFALAFDSRLVFVYDPDARRIESVIRTGRGPHAIAFDTSPKGTAAADRWSYLYIGHFTDSYIGVVDLDMRRQSTFGSMFLTVGKPVPPRGSK